MTDNDRQQEMYEAILAAKAMAQAEAEVAKTGELTDDELEGVAGGFGISTNPFVMLECDCGWAGTSDDISDVACQLLVLAHSLERPGCKFNYVVTTHGIRKE